MRIVLDSSAILALLLNETGGDRVGYAMPDAIVSTVNLAEIVAILIRGGNAEDEVRGTIADLSLAAVPPDEAMAIDAGALVQATRSAGLSLGDRFCLVLARRVSAPVMTADAAWTKVAAEVGVEVRMVR